MTTAPHSPNPPPWSLLISAGEASGDALGAELLAELATLKPGVQAFGLGGDALQSAGAEVLVHARELAVVGLWEVVRKLPLYLQARRSLLEEVEVRRPSLAVLVDFADFHQHLARDLHRRGIPVVQYVSPQVWAWRRGRVRDMARHLTEILCILPFEPPLHRREGLPATFVGHPVLDRIHRTPTRSEARLLLALPEGAPVVSLLPGSREGELKRMWPAFLATARLIHQAVPDVVFLVPLASTISAHHLPGWDQVPSLRLLPEASLLCLSASDTALVASGTATLEAALLGIPHVIAYRVSVPTWILGRLLVRGVAHIGMPNLLLGERALPEHLQHLHPPSLSLPLLHWLGNEDDRRRTAERLLALRPLLSSGVKASQRAAMKLLSVLDSSSAPSSLPPGQASPRETRHLWTAILALTALRLLLAARFELTPDEAYYRVWGHALAAGYHAHAPAVAFLARGAELLAGTGGIAARLPAIACSSLALWVFHGLCRRFSTPSQAGLATTGLALMPLFWTGSLLTLPDAPLMLAWILALSAAADLFVDFRGQPPPGTRWLFPWLSFGLFTGLALLSKYHGVLLILCAAVALLILPRSRVPISHAGPWLASLLAALLFAPVIAWNAHHHWISFALQLRHGFDGGEGNAPLRLLSFAGGQLALLTPLIPLSLLPLFLRAGRREGDATGILRFCLAFSLPVLLLFTFSCLQAPVEPNWTAPAWPAVLLALAASGAAATLRWTALLSGFFALLVSLHAVLPFLPVPPSLDPVSRIHGQKELGAVLLEDIRALERETGRTPVVVASNYKDASWMAAYVPGAIPYVGKEEHLPHGSFWVTDLPGHGRTSQWDLWGMPPSALESPILWVSPAGKMTRPGFCLSGMAVEGPFLREAFFRQTPVRRYHAWRCLPRGVPLSPPRASAAPTGGGRSVDPGEMTHE